VLDIGCGRGWTLAALREQGWQVRGVELSEHAARHAVDELKIDVDDYGFEPSRYEPASFDAIVLWHVLEHVRDPLATLDGIARLLRPGGILAVAVPNRASWQAALTRYAWFHLDLPRHLWHFSAKQLEELLKQHHLHVVETNFASAEQNPFGWIQSVLNSLRFKHNLLYDLIRAEAARNTKRPWRSYPVQSLASVLLGAILLPWAVAMLLPEWLLRTGATVEIYARKNP
jgi:SAM-dependent methyltransferase